MKDKLERALLDSRARSFIWTNDVLAFFTLASILSIILETVPALFRYQLVFDTVEWVSVSFFTLEYLARIYVAERKSRYIFSFFGIIDLLSIIPTYLGLTNLTFLKSARILRILRFLRIVRLTKLARLEKIKIHDMEEHSHIYRLNLQIYFLALASAIIIFGSLLYVFEGNQIEAENVPVAMIWIAKVIMGGVAQATPSSVWGDIVIILSRFTGLALFGLLIHVIGNLVKRLLFGGSDATAEKPKQ